MVLVVGHTMGVKKKHKNNAIHYKWQISGQRQSHPRTLKGDSYVPAFPVESS